MSFGVPIVYEGVHIVKNDACNDVTLPGYTKKDALKCIESNPYFGKVVALFIIRFKDI